VFLKTKRSRTSSWVAALTHGSTSGQRTGIDPFARCGARMYDPFLALGEHEGMRERRRVLLAGAEGRVLELGAGTGLNLAHYPPAARELVLTEPEPAMHALLQRRVTRSTRPARVVTAAAEALPFPDATFDTVVSTMVLCTVQDVLAALRETRRVLRRGGRLLFIEHVQASSPRLARWQDRLAMPWSAFAQGCRCNLPTEALLAREFRLTHVTQARWRGMPALVHPLIVGEAVA
jgi:ubiquinone/menaquinone biosynthesis C-methylase UbiE